MNYKFITEQPATDELKFGHKEILDTLESIVKDCDTPFTIGLFGKWGSGKSSIAENLKGRLLKGGGSIPVILFDVWKHEGDALRRTFLKEMVKQLQAKPYGRDFFSKDFKLKDTVNASRETAKPAEITIDFKAVLPLLIRLAFIGGVLLLTFGIFALFQDSLPSVFQQLFQKTLDNIFTVATVVASISWLFTNIKDFASKTEITVTEDRITDPHEFEGEFKRVLEHLTNARVIIIFDNLDRVSGENALEIISTIKTFLEPADKAIERKEVVFLLPCDVEAIKKHLKKVLRDDNSIDSDTDVYADEFLRKFFNTILWIPDFYSIELEKFATDKLQETKIKEFNDDHLAWLIIQVFKDNPRQIIQFINTLISNYILLANKSRENAFGDVNFYKSNVPQLAKYLLLIQRFPAIMEKYKASKTYDLNLDIVDAKTPGALDFFAFRTHTSDIVIPTLEPFFNFKLSEQEKSIPGVSKLLQLLQDGEMEQAINYGIDLKIKDKINEFSQTIDNYLSPKNNSVLVCSFLNNLFMLTNKLDIILRANSYREIQKKFESAAVLSTERIRPNLLVSEFLQRGNVTFGLTRGVKQKLVERWVGILTETKASGEAIQLARDFEIELNFNLINHIHDLSGQFLIQYKSFVTQHYSNDIELCSLIIHHKNANQVIKPEFIQNIIGHLSVTSENDQGRFFVTIQLLKKVSSLFLNGVDGTLILQKISLMLNNELIKKNAEEKTMILENLKLLIDLLIKPIGNVADINILNGVSAALTNSFNQHRWDWAHLYIPIFDTLETLNKDPFNQHGRAARVEFFQNLPHIKEDKTEYTLQHLNDASKTIDLPDHIPHLNSLVNQSETFFRVLYKYASPRTRGTWLVQLVNGHKFPWLINSLDVINAFEIVNKKEVFHSVVERMRTITGKEEANNVLKFLQGVNMLVTDVDRLPLYDVIFGLIQNPNGKEIGDNYFKNSKFIDEEGRLAVAEKLLAHLPNDPYNSSALSAVKISFPSLTSEKQVEFFRIIYERLILNPTSDFWIKEGIGLLRDLTMRFNAEQLDALKQKAVAYRDGNQLQFFKPLIQEVGIFIKDDSRREIKDVKAWFQQELQNLNS